MKNPAIVGIMPIIIIWAVIGIAVGTGSLYVASYPTNATILINDTSYGTTNSLVQSLPSGNQNLTLSKDGYQSYTTVVNIPTSDVKVLAPIILTKASATIPGNSNDPFTAIQAEENARIEGDQALWTNATEQQNAINAIPEPLHIGDWQQKENDKLYTATTDGFVLGYASGAPSPNVIIEAILTPDGKKYKIYSTINPGDIVSFNLPVKAGYSWLVYQNTANSSEPLIDFTIYWIPLEN